MSLKTLTLMLTKHNNYEYIKHHHRSLNSFLDRRIFPSHWRRIDPFIASSGVNYFRSSFIRFINFNN